MNTTELQSTPSPSITYFMPETETCEFQFHMGISKSEFSAWVEGFSVHPHFSKSVKMSPRSGMLQLKLMKMLICQQNINGSA